MFLLRRDQIATQLEELPRSKMSKNLEKLTSVVNNSASASPKERAHINQVTQELNADYAKSATTLSMSNHALAFQDYILPLVLSVGRTDVLFGRTIYRLRSNELTEIGKLADNPDRDFLDGIVGKRHIFTKLIDTIFAVSSDGKYAASGLHIYDLQSKKPIKRLPAVSSLVVFSENNRDLYVYDEGHQSLLVVTNWLESLPPLN
jgi:hypothetical protein